MKAYVDALLAATHGIGKPQISSELNLDVNLQSPMVILAQGDEPIRRKDCARKSVWR